MTFFLGGQIRGTEYSPTAALLDDQMNNIKVVPGHPARSASRKLRD